MDFGLGYLLRLGAGQLAVWCSALPRLGREAPGENGGVSLGVIGLRSLTVVLLSGWLTLPALAEEASVAQTAPMAGNPTLDAPSVPAVSPAPLVIPENYKLLSLPEQSIDVVYPSNLREFTYSPEQALRIPTNKWGRLSCAAEMAEALRSAGYRVETPDTPGFIEFSCRIEFSGTGRQLDAALQKYRDKQNTAGNTVVKALAITAAIAGQVIGVSGISPARIDEAIVVREGAGALVNAAVWSPLIEKYLDLNQGRPFGDDEYAVVSHVCSAKPWRTPICGYLAVLLHKSVETQPDAQSREAMRAAFRQGILLSARFSNPLPSPAPTSDVASATHVALPANAATPGALPKSASTSEAE